MDALLRLSRLIDALNDRVGRSIYWLILIMVIIATLNAVVRKLFNVSSNAFLEIQWYLFAAVFMLGAGNTLLKNEHVRIDIITSRLSTRGQLMVDLLGSVLFLLPLCLLIIYYAWPYFMLSFNSQEWSSNPGGLIVWPAKILIPVGFILLMLQGVSQIFKLIGALSGRVDPATLLKSHAHGGISEEEIKAMIEAQKQEPQKP